MDGLRDRGLVDTSGRFTDAGRAPYDWLEPAELEEPIASLEPIPAKLIATGSDSGR